MNNLDETFLLRVARNIWHDNFLDRSFPEKVEFGKGYDHQIVLLGNKNSWEYSFRFGITRDITNEQKMLEYLNFKNPPVNLAKTFKQVKTSFNPPFDKCLIQIPVNGETLFNFLKHASISDQKIIGEKLGLFIKWVNSLDKSKFDKEDVLQKTFYQDHEFNKKKLTKYGLAENKISRLLEELENILKDKNNLVPCHGDLYPHHTFVDSNLNLGVIDWGDSAVSDYLKDFRFFYEPFEGRIVFKEIYPELFKSACQSYRENFPSKEEERRLKLYALGGVLCYEEIEDLSHIDDWIKTYGNEFL